MGQRVEFPSNAHTCQGYFAGKGPAVVVIQEYWGLVPHIQDVVDRFAKDGFAAIAPDLYHGKIAKSPDEGAKLLMEMDAERAEREIAGAGEWLIKQPASTSKTYGVVGFCMGGGLAQYTGTKEGAKVGAVVSFYGGFRRVQMDWNDLRAPILLLYGEKDQGVPPEHGHQLEQQLKKLGKSVQLVVYPGAGHAFFNDTRKEAYRAEAAGDAWRRTVDFLRSSLTPSR